MYEQVEKPKESKSRDVGNSVTHNKSDVKQAFRYIDDRSKSKTKEINKVQRTSLEFNDKVAQLKLPYDGYADTRNFYKARESAKNETYTSGRPTKFTSVFKEKMVKKQWNGYQDPESGKWTVQTGGLEAYVLPMDAIQIDHSVPWERIEAKLTVRPSTVLQSPNQINDWERDGYIVKNQDKFSQYAARMYYHDTENLQPMSGSENAAKGATAPLTGPNELQGIANRVAKTGGISNKMIAAAQEAFREWGSNASDLNTIDTELLRAEYTMAEVTDNLAGI